MDSIIPILSWLTEGGHFMGKVKMKNEICEVWRILLYYYERYAVTSLPTRIILVHFRSEKTCVVHNFYLIDWTEI